MSRSEPLEQMTAIMKQSIKPHCLSSAKKALMLNQNVLHNRFSQTNKLFYYEYYKYYYEYYKHYYEYIDIIGLKPFIHSFIHFQHHLQKHFMINTWTTPWLMSMVTEVSYLQFI